MANSGAAGASAAAAAGAIAEATKASGAIVKMTPQEFQKILNRAGDSLVVTGYYGWPSKKHHYLTSYRGIFFYTKSDRPLVMPSGAEQVAVEKIWIPG